MFDHTSIIKTILARFRPQALGEWLPARVMRARPGLGPEYPGTRTVRTSHLGKLLTRDTPGSPRHATSWCGKPRPEPH